MMPYPDYGTPGNPNMDPYYISPETEARLIRERHESIDEDIKDTKEAIVEALETLERLLKKQDAALVSVTVDVGNLGVTIEVKQ